MSTLLVLDTATPATVVGVRGPGGVLVERRHDPAPGERPGHVAQLPALALDACAEAGVSLRQLDRIGAGVGPGSFTGLRIGIATARSLAQASDRRLVGISTLAALAAGAEAQATVLAVLDARRGEAFVAAYRAGRQLLAAAAVEPAGLAEVLERLGGAALAVGDGAIVFRDQLELAGATVPEDESRLHRVSAAGLCAVAAEAPDVARDELVPEYVRAPDARPRSAA